MNSLLCDRFGKTIPEKFREIFTYFKYLSFNTSFVGECVRNYFTGKRTTFYEIATSTPLEKVMELLKPLETEDKKMEVSAYYRSVTMKVGNYVLIVYSYKDITGLDYLKSRFYTVDAIEYDGTQILDPFNGIKDIEKKTINLIGDSDKVFSKDPLAILIGIRLAASLNFTIDEALNQSMSYYHVNLLNIPKRYSGAEVLKILSYPIKKKDTIEAFLDVLAYLYPSYMDFYFLGSMRPLLLSATHKILSKKLPPYFKLALMLRFTLEDSRAYEYKIKREGDCGVDFFRQTISDFCLKELKTTQDFAKVVLSIHEAGNRLANNYALYNSKHRYELHKPAEQLLYDLGNGADNLYFFTFLYAIQVYKYVLFLTKEELINADRFLKVIECVKNRPSFYPYKLEHLTIDASDLKYMGFAADEADTFLQDLLREIVTGKIYNFRDRLLDRAYNYINMENTKILALPQGSIEQKMLNL